MWENPESFRAFSYTGIELLKVFWESERFEIRLHIDLGTSLMTAGGWLDSTLM